MAMTSSAIVVDLAPDYLKEAGFTLDFIDDDELPAMLVEIESGVFEFLQIAGLFEIDVDRIEILGDGEGEGGFSDLTGSQNHNRRGPV